EALAQIALRHNLWMLSDEVWSDIVYPPYIHTSTAALGPEVAARTFTVYGFSKGYALAGLRLGLLSSPTPAAHAAILALSHANDTAEGASTLSQVAGVAALGQARSWLKRFVQHLDRQRSRVVARLN